MSFENWKEKISEKLDNLPDDHKYLLLAATNTGSKDELIFTLMNRYKELDPKEVFEKHPEYLNQNFLRDAVVNGSYKDSINHDKTSGNYGRHIDRWTDRDFERIFVRDGFKAEIKQNEQ
jgi:hypothetical protein